MQITFRTFMSEQLISRILETLYKKCESRCLSLYSMVYCHRFHLVVDAVEFGLTCKHLDKKAPSGHRSIAFFTAEPRCVIFSVAIIGFVSDARETVTSSSVFTKYLLHFLFVCDNFRPVSSKYSSRRMCLLIIPQHSQ